MEDMEILKKINFFKSLNEPELSQIISIVEHASFQAGQNVVSEGTVCDAFYIINTGSVKVTKEGNHLADIGKEEPIGEISFIDKGLRSATVSALEDTSLIRIPADAFEKLLSQERNLACKVYKAIAEILCHRLRETNDVLKLIRD